ncbi:MerR family DNA-binding transcriptional regulator [Reinekea marina]|uniref:MerR family DNA-binding transcriptional regulator n=1 Tax=Reinekea marina TaxID=1310421 RepID=A0ABV7WTF6_9GAMM|nr:MerR family DNA-binding transcriptional regulator [Reinekea marina]MBU2864020.1 MerR family DNA-binding transcriptional regulator [Reinekea forsetii]MDN3648087.1 MerR family DNA-binding transcriptional regulator [Reinekea marina]
MTQHTQDDTFSIRDLADEFGITTRTIRFYEDKGLVTPTRQGQRRIYHKRDKARLKLILRGKRLGFSLDEIVHLVTLYETPNDKLPQLQVYLETLTGHKETLLQQKRDLEQTLIELERAERECRQAIAKHDDVAPESTSS